MWLKIPTSELVERKFWVDEDSASAKFPVRIVTGKAAELRLTWEEADDLMKQLNYLLMDREYRSMSK